MKWHIGTKIFLYVILLIFSSSCIKSIHITDLKTFTLTLNISDLKNATLALEQSIRSLANSSENTKEKQKIYEMEEKILLKRKNDIADLLKINMSKFDIDQMENDFESSFNTLKIINEKLHSMKTSHTGYRISPPVGKRNHSKNKGSRKNKTKIDKLQNKTVHIKTNKTDNNTKQAKNVEPVSKNATISQNYTVANNDSIKKINNDNDTKLSESKTNKNISLPKNNSINANITKIQNATIKENTFANKSLSEYLESISYNDVELHPDKNSTNEVTEHHLNSNANNNVNVNDNINNTNSDVDITEFKKNKKEPRILSNRLAPNSNFMASTPKTSLQKDNKEKNITFYSQLINISLSLIVIGLLMGVLLGLILVMYVKTKKDSK